MTTDLSAIPAGVLVALVVLAAAALALDIVALVDLYRRPAALLAFGNKWIWLVLILFLNLLGPILYLLLGRKPAPRAEATGQSGPAGPARVTDVVDKLYGPPDNSEQQ
ncbi:PLDc N-terminal domain-containing protein [Arthrobacter silvisoli]|uniref:PLDc N-terminal domain-containing protein n=1 Tax=Arthrobacter silvisoli TaxID=2291022 RepID=UPI000E216005|nr:PLDc N-terminal domain-containing protein [Arthrobacter silvisoli]